jgi:hypothetical protein
LPPHLGWHSPAVTQALRRRLPASTPAPIAPLAANQPTQSTSFVAPAERPASVKLYPDIALALLRRRLVAPGRLWLLLHHLANGQGWLTVATARAALTTPASPHYLCGWRRLRALLQQGQGLFWRQENGRLWLRSTVKVAAALKVTRLNGRPVALPLPALRGPIASLRAHFYASFHSGRRARDRASAKPIARATLAALTGASRASQRHYERRARVGCQANYALCPAPAPADEQRLAWRRGRALFRLNDRRGVAGPAGSAALAWQLPNTYSGPHCFAPKGRQKRMNRQLTDLFMKGMTGNGQREVQQRYYGNGMEAARAYGRAIGDESYWPCLRRRAHGPGLWHTLCAPIGEG